MTKSDLRSGMVVELRDYEEDNDARYLRYLLVNDNNGKLYGINERGYNEISDDYREDLTVKSNDEYMCCCDIVKVYKPKQICGIISVLMDNNLELLWDRSKKKIEELPFEKSSYKQMTEKLNELIKVVNEMSDKIC